MNVNQFNAALKKLDLDNTELANILQINDRTIRRFASGQWPVPVPIAMLLNLMIKTNSTKEDLKG
jgi:plasmid maintenance system antidote protein VapI